MPLHPPLSKWVPWTDLTSSCMHGKLAIYQPLRSFLWAVLGCIFSSPFRICLWGSLGCLACTLKLGYISFSMTVLLSLAAVLLQLWLNLPGKALLFMAANNTQVMKNTSGSIKQGSARRKRHLKMFSNCLSWDYRSSWCTMYFCHNSKIQGGQGATLLFGPELGPAYELP